MIQYTIRRILLAIPVIFGILVVTFFLARAIPGDPCKSILGEKATQASCERFNKENGLDKPVFVQFTIYMGKVLQGDFGESIRFSRPVMQILIERLPLTLELGFTAITIAILLGVPAGVISAVRQNSAVDVVTMIGANTGVSMPVYWLGLMLAYLFAITLKDTPFWLPPSGRLTAGLVSVPFYEAWGWQITEGTISFNISQFFSNLYIFNSIITGDWIILGDALKHLLLPAFALSTIPLSIIARITRSSMLEVLRQDYVRTARAKGLFERVVITKHVFRNALLPIVTIIGLQMGTVFAGAVLTESIFSLAGVGRMLFEAITARDFPIVQAFTVVIAIGYVAVNLLVDLSYVFIDPRIRLK
ncbi:MAG TPA: ABC transporter permease [Anaerolineales bacterium]|nr:ABC transporter permease [Anaerolineales bacterium]